MTKNIEEMPWGVKGIDKATRHLVKQAAGQAGMTIGAWVKKAVHDQAAGDNRDRGVELPDEPPAPAIEKIPPRVATPTSEDEEAEDELSYITAPAAPLATNYHGATSKTYLGNPNLKAAGVKIEFTQEQYDEYVKCARDPVYFIVNYIRIVNVDRGLVPFRMYPYQANMVQTFRDNRFVVSKLPRQTGKSTTVVSFMLWKILFHDQQSVAILANKGALARDMLAKLQLAYEHLPAWLQQGVVTWNKGNIILENGSKVIAASTSSSAVRGGTYNLIFLDEYAFVPRNIAEHFFSSVYPTISSGETTQIIVVSTPFGLNHFYKMWTDAVEKRSLYTPIEVHWRDTPGRDDKFRDQTIKNTSLEQWRQEFECEFIGSTNTLINPTVLRSLAFVTPTRDNIGFEIYKMPERDRTYVMTVDTARGVEGDSSAVSVIDVSSVPYEQVAKYKNNQIPSALFPDVVARCGRMYNGAMALVETNDVGQQVADALLALGAARQLADVGVALDDALVAEIDGQEHDRPLRVAQIAAHRHRQHAGLRLQETPRARAPTFDEIFDRMAATHDRTEIFHQHDGIQRIAGKTSANEERPALAQQATDDGHVEIDTRGDVRNRIALRIDRIREQQVIHVTAMTGHEHDFVLLRHFA